MIITYKNISLLEFPVFLLPSTNWELADGLLFLDGQLLDDKNMSGTTLGQRRLQSPFTELLPLKHSINSHLGLIKNSGPAYIDLKGRPFLYEKTLFCKLIYHQIKKVERKEVLSLLWVRGIKFPFTIPRPPKENHLWVGVLYMKGFPWLLYEYSETRLKSTRRKV